MYIRQIRVRLKGPHCHMPDDGGPNFEQESRKTEYRYNYEFSDSISKMEVKMAVITNDAKAHQR